jgi:hypothetical protein
MSIEIAKATVKKVKEPKVIKEKVIKEKVIKEKVIKDANPHTKSDTEAINLAKIHNHLNSNTPCGMKIRQAFTEAFPDSPQFTASVISGGNRSIHHDFQIKWANLDNLDTLKNVEFKGSKYKKVVDATKPPWVDGVQFYNGTGRNFGVGKEYARQFYDTMLDEIISHYNITTPKPSYEEWEKDAFCQGKPKTPFVIELRSKGYCSDYLSECRKKFNKQFVLNESQLETLKNEVFDISNQVLSSKDYWLQIHGTMDEPDDFEVKWTGKQCMTPIVNVERSISKSDCDVNFKFTCEDGNVFSAKLRWGYGQCITNIRLDIK